MSRRVEVADRALDQVAFLVDQRRRGRFEREVADLVPQPQQVFEVALDLGLGALAAGGAHDHAHAVGHVEIAHQVLEPPPVGGAGDLARDAAAARRVRHQHAIAAGERQVGGQRRALVAALLLGHLHQHDLPALDHLLDLVVAERPDALARRFLDLVAAHRLDRLDRGAALFRHRGVLGGGIGLGRLGGHRLVLRPRRLRIRQRQAGALVLAVRVVLAGMGVVKHVRARGAGRQRRARLGREAVALGGIGRQVQRLRRPFRHLGRDLLRRVFGGLARLGAAGILDQLALARIARLLRAPVAHRNAVIVGVDLVEGEEPVAVAAVFNECRL